MIRPSAAYGSWATGLNPAERLARLRSLRAITRAYLGPRGQQLADCLHRAESDDAALIPALDALDRRRVLASFASLSRPDAGAAR